MDSLIFDGYRICPSPFLPQMKFVQFRFPKTKKARIQKKWRKNQQNYRYIKNNDMYVLTGNIIVCSFEQFRFLKAKLVADPRIRAFTDSVKRGSLMEVAI